MAGTIKQDAEGMAEAIEDIAENVLEGEAMLDDMDDYNMDRNAAKVRIAYGVYLGEENDWEGFPFST